MSFRRLAQEWLPPAVLRFVRTLRRGKEAREWEIVDSWQRTTRGWNVDSVADVQARRWPNYISAISGTAPLTIPREYDRGHLVDLSGHNAAMMFGYVVMTAAYRKSRLRILDWGGGVGHYAVLARALAPDVEIDYTVYDVPRLLETGRSLATGAKFVESRSEALEGRYDLILASGSLFYEREWRSAVSELAATTEYLFITRTPFVFGAPSYVAIQRPSRAAGYMTEYLCWVFNRDEMVSQATACGMELVREFLMEDGPVIRRAPEQPVYRGFLFRGRKESE